MSGPRESINWPIAPCCSPGNGGCACAPMERALRAWSGGYEGIPAMTAEQRNACLDEIGQVEGWIRSEHADLSDGDLARNVLSAWMDFCRDKGLID